MARSSFDVLLSADFGTMQADRPRSRRGSSLMDIALGTTQFADLAFGRFVQLPVWDVPVPEDVPPAPAVEEQTAPSLTSAPKEAVQTTI